MASRLGDLIQSDLSCDGLAPAAKCKTNPIDPIAACKALAQQLKHNMPCKLPTWHSNISLDDAIQHMQTHAEITCRGRTGQVCGTFKQS